MRHRWVLGGTDLTPTSGPVTLHPALSPLLHMGLVPRVRTETHSPCCTWDPAWAGGRGWAQPALTGGEEQNGPHTLTSCRLTPGWLTVTAFRT